MYPRWPTASDLSDGTSMWLLGLRHKTLDLQRQTFLFASWTDYGSTDAGTKDLVVTRWWF